MGYLGDSLLTAIELILSFDREVRTAVWVSLYTSCCAIVIAALLGVPVGLWLGLNRFRGRKLMITLLNTLMALPTVVVGLLLFGLFLLSLASNIPATGDVESEIFVSMG